MSLSTIDLLYADQYFSRAESLLPALCTREQYRALRHDAEQQPRLKADLHRSIECGDWPTVRALAQQGAEVQHRLAINSAILPLAEAVYGPHMLHADATTLALHGVVPQPNSDLVHACDAILDHLRLLLSRDPEWAAFYHARITHFEQVELLAGNSLGVAVDADQLQERILEAVEKGNFARVKRLTAAIAAEDTAPAAHRHLPMIAVDRRREIAQPFPVTAVDRAGELGLSLETLPAMGALNEYVSSGNAERATSSEDAPLSQPTRSSDASPSSPESLPDVPTTLRRNLDLLREHPFISSGGTRYLPWFGEETMLVETFPESEPEAATGLLSALGLPRRRGVSRLLIENALLTFGPHVCDQLSLDPAVFVVACIPFDAYHRLAPKRGWGQRELWTHFDGYQVTHDLHLLALVGGNARFGGPDDLSSLARDYDSERLTVRFVILRRARFQIRLPSSLGSPLSQ